MVLVIEFMSSFVYEHEYLNLSATIKLNILHNIQQLSCIRT